jgi:hypothetical protein
MFNLRESFKDFLFIVVKFVFIFILHFQGRYLLKTDLFPHKNCEAGKPMNRKKMDGNIGLNPRKEGVSLRNSC